MFILIKYNSKLSLYNLLEMSILTPVKMVFNDSASQFNKDLTDFLKRNLETAIKRGHMSFEWVIAKPSDLAQLRKLGVKKLPAMIINDVPTVSVPAIIEEIRRRIKNCKQEVSEKSDDEIVREFMIDSLGKITKDANGQLQPEKDEQEENLGETLKRKADEAYARRQQATEGGNRGAPARNTQQEHDDEDYQPRQRQRDPPQQRAMQQRATPQAGPRQDNIDDTGVEGAKKLVRASRDTGEGADQDNAMMMALLDRLGEDSF